MIKHHLVYLLQDVNTNLKRKRLGQVCHTESADSGFKIHTLFIFEFIPDHGRQGPLEVLLHCRDPFSV